MRSGKDVGYGFFIALGWADAASAGRQVEREPLCSHTQLDAKMMRSDERRADAKALFSGMRHTSSKHAGKHTVSAAWSWRLGRVKQVCLLSFSEEELCGREPFDEMHESMAVRALP